MAVVEIRLQGPLDEQITDTIVTKQKSTSSNSERSTSVKSISSRPISPKPTSSTPGFTSVQEIIKIIRPTASKPNPSPTSIPKHFLNKQQQPKDNQRGIQILQQRQPTQATSQRVCAKALHARIY